MIHYWKKKIHVFGDSHASFCFTGNKPATKQEEKTLYQHTASGKKIFFPICINWLGAKTMYSFGKNETGKSDIRKYGVRENEIAVFLFGEIDVRCHIGRIRDLQKRNEDEVLSELVISYIRTIVQNRTNIHGLVCIVTTTVPPSALTENKDFPIYGTLEERVRITKKLNSFLKTECLKNNISILDPFSKFTAHDGSLDFEASDKIVHVDPKKNFIIKNLLADLLLNAFGDRCIGGIPASIFLKMYYRILKFR